MSTALTELFKLSHVPRWVIVDVTRQQSVGEHTFRTMAIVKELVEGMNSMLHLAPKLGDCLHAALLHDQDEANTGDVPHPTKRSIKEIIGDEQYGTLFPDNRPDSTAHTSMEHAVVKLADALEGYIFISRYGVRPDRIRAYMAEVVHSRREDLISAMDHHVGNGTMPKDYKPHVNRAVLRALCESIQSEGFSYE